MNQLRDYNDIFLKETNYCDFSNSEIQKLAKKHKEDFPDETERARKLFLFVRDHTKYTVGNWNKKASETLKLENGTCTNNANLLVALLRATGIPAGYGVMTVVGPEYFGPIILSELSGMISARSKHIYAVVYINDRWIKCDPSDDEPLSINTEHLNPQSKLVEWNGINDGILNLHPSHIIEDESPVANIDHLINKRSKTYKQIPIWIGNLYIEFLRQEGMSITSYEDLRPRFLSWLKKESLFAYMVTITFLKVKKLFTFETEKKDIQYL